MGEANRARSSFGKPQEAQQVISRDGRTKQKKKREKQKTFR